MKITKKQLRRIIREAKQNFLAENASRYADGDLVEDFNGALHALFENTFWHAFKDVWDGNAATTMDKAMEIAQKVVNDRVPTWGEDFKEDIYNYRFMIPFEEVIKQYLAGELEVDDLYG